MVNINHGKLFAATVILTISKTVSVSCYSTVTFISFWGRRWATLGTSPFLFLQMSQKEDSENDIWEYKPLQKKKKRHESQPATVTKRRCPSRKSSKRDTSLSVKSPDRKVKTAENGECSTVVINIDGPNCLEAHNLPSHSSPTNHTVQTDCAAAKGPSSGDFCPMCQMPFSILVVQTQRWHVAECLDTPRDTCKGTDIHTAILNLKNDKLDTN